MTFSRTCNPTVKKFYEDFDLLPYELKELLWYLPAMPDFDDLKTAWKLAEAQKGSEWLRKTLNCFEEERKEARRQRREERAQAQAAERQQKSMAKWGARSAKWCNVYALRPVDHSNDKHGRLVARVTEEEAARLLARRVENKDVVEAVTHERVFLRKERIEQPSPEQPMEEPKRRVQQLARSMHNAGGKTDENALKG